MSTADQGDLFGAGQPRPVAAAGLGSRPLAVRMRPRRLTEVVGQEHILGPDALLPRLIANGQLGSILLYGPPGCGKTTLAEVIAEESGCRFVRVNAVLSNVAELRDILKLARYQPEARTLVFIDEIHRFNKAQQDLLLPDVEAGNIRLIGATTHNPGFYVIPPLLSRSHLFKLEPVAVPVLVSMLEKALKDSERGLGGHRVEVEDGVLEKLAIMADGDMRRALNALETLVLSLPMGSVLGLKELDSYARERQIRYDAGEDEHYDTASAFIKSMRGNDPDAALYWLAKMLLGGEDPRFIARRLVIFASEDVGMADPRALPLATATFAACEQIGLPECELNLAHCTVFLATTAKSNSTTLAIGKVKQSIRDEGLQKVPLWLRDAHTKLNKSLGQGAGYQYSHDFPENVSGQDYMERPKTFYQPKSMGAETHVVERLKNWKHLKSQIRKGSSQ